MYRVTGDQGNLAERRYLMQKHEWAAVFERFVVEMDRSRALR